MQRALLVKAAVVAAIYFILQVPLGMINSLVAERSERQRAVVAEISTSNYGKQFFAGPILSIPYVEEYEETVTENKVKKTETVRIKHLAWFFPESAEIAGKVSVGTKYRGLFKARVFNWQAHAKGVYHFDGKFTVERAREASRITWGQPAVSLLLGDPRGLVGSPAFHWKGSQVAMERGSDVPGAAGGLHAAVPGIDPTRPQRLEYALEIGLLGTESLSIVPLAGNETVRLASDWRHPSFGGQFLPRSDSRRSSGEGFDAQWIVSALASGAQRQLLPILEGRKDCSSGLCADGLSVQLIEPVAIYTLSDRALKYGFLFVGITFGCFFLFELLKDLRIHPAQYFLVGLALATFFLLLLGLSEHIAFWIAYAVAAAACILLQGFYLGTVLRGAGRGFSFSILLTALYGALYGLLISEDNALLLGSILVFALVAAAMLITRKLDWYALGTRKT